MAAPDQSTRQPSLEEQALILIDVLEKNKFEKDSPVLKKAADWIGKWPHQLPAELKERLTQAICTSFSITIADIYAVLEGVDRAAILKKSEPGKSQDDRLRALLPTGGWFEWYDAYTRFNEAPLSYHIFSSFTVLSAAVGRRIYMDMGFFKIYPTCSIVLVGPPGKVKKTSATDIARDLVSKTALCPILPDKITPERLVTALTRSGHQYLCAEELCFFFGRQKYNEGLIPIMLKVLTGRDTIEVETQARELETVENVAVTFLAGTTPSLLSTNVPAEVISSGFLSRILLVHEHTTDRKFAIPGRGLHEDKLLETILRLKQLQGVLKLSEEATKWHASWYDKLWDDLRGSMDEMESDMKSRSQIHMLRLAMLIHIVQCDNFSICVDCLQRACKLIEFLNKSAPNMIRTLKQNAISQEADLVYDAIIKMGGAAEHSPLLRRVANKMNAQQFKQHIRTLEESGRVKVGKKGGGGYYVATGVNDEVD